MIVAALLLIVGGFACTALSMPRHRQQVFERETAHRTSLVWRATGWPLLGLALVPCIAQNGTSAGLATWTGLLTVGVVLVAMLLTYRPRKVFSLAIVASVLGIVVTALAGSR